MFRVPQVGVFLSVIIHKGLCLLGSSFDLSTLVPERLVDQGRHFESILDVLSVIYLSSHLAQEHRHRWRLLFSTQLHGQSFSQLCSHITNQGPSLVVLEDRDGYIFGGFASCSWEVKPQFQGKQWVLCWAVLTANLAQPGTPEKGVLWCRSHCDRPAPPPARLFYLLKIPVST